MIAAQRLRVGNVGSPRGAARAALVVLALIRRTHLAGRAVLARADSADNSRALVTAMIKTGADVSITVRMDAAVKRAIATIQTSAWTTIKYADAVYDEQAGVWISKVEVAEVPFTAFTSKEEERAGPGRLVVRRIPDLSPKKDQGQGTLFTTWRFHAFFPTTERTELDTVTADQAHRRHAIIGERPRRPQGLPPWRTCPPALQRQRRLADLLGDGVQPDPRRCDVDTDAVPGPDEHRDDLPDPEQDAP